MTSTDFESAVATLECGVSPMDPSAVEALPPIHHRTYVDAPRQEIFVLIASAEGWDSWFTRGSQVDPRPGGQMTLRWRDWGPDRVTTESRSVIVCVEFPRLFSFQWQPGESVTTVTFTLEPLGPGTTIDLLETGYHATDTDLRAMAACASGWGEALTLLKFYAESGRTYRSVPWAQLQTERPIRAV